MTYSQGFRESQRSDEEIAADTTGETVCFVNVAHYRRVMFLGFGAVLLDLAEDTGAKGVREFLTSIGLAGGIYEPPG